MHKGHSWVLVMVAPALVFAPPPARAQVCPPTTYASGYVEQFDTATYEDAASGAAGWGQGTITLPAKGKLLDGAHGNLDKPIAAVAAGDFDEDGDEDLMGLHCRPEAWCGNGSPCTKESDCLAVGSSNCRLDAKGGNILFFANKGMSGSTHLGFEKGVAIPELKPKVCTEEGAILRSGDIDGDGKLDLLYGFVEDIHGEGEMWPQVGNSSRHPLRVFRNLGVASAGDTPVFHPSGQQTTIEDDPDNIRWHWGADSMQLVTWNNDLATLPPNDTPFDRADLVIARSDNDRQRVYLYLSCHYSYGGSCFYSSDFGNTYAFGFNRSTSFQAGIAGRRRLIEHAGFTGPVAGSSATPVPFPSNACPPSRSRGITVVLAEDFDADGDWDLVLGSMSEHDLRHFSNSGTNAAPVFTNGSETVVPFDKGGVTYGVSGDFNLDGWPDIIVGTDRHGCDGSDGRVWLLENDTAGGFALSTVPLVDMGNDIDWITKVDVDSDGNQDVLVGRNVRGAPYYASYAKGASYYHRDAVAISKPVQAGAIDPDTEQIVSVRVENLNTTIPADTSVTLYVSNDDGDTWEQVSADELPPVSDWHAFSSHGSVLRWKMELHAEAAVLTGKNAIFTPAADETPEVSDLELSYQTVGQVRFSRSGIALGVVTVSGTNREILYTAHSLYPGFQGSVVALDITAVPYNTSTNLTTHALVTTLWDAGAKLDTTAGMSRTIHTAYAAGGSGPLDDLLTFTLPLTPELQTLMNTTDDDDWRFVRDGMTLGAVGDTWKLYDLGHSTPVFVGQPLGDETFFDPTGANGYGAFKAANAGRKAMVYIGANDGALHAFDAITGDEDWAFIPNNLLEKLKTQRGGGDKYEHGFFVDGPVVVRDVFDSGTWKTILIGGQARGQGRADENYYFALDVSNPAGPQPLWEFTDPWDRYGGTCDGDPCDPVCTLNCPPDSCRSTCDWVASTLATGAVAGDTSLTIQVADCASFPATGTVIINREDPNASETLAYDAKSGVDRLDLVGSLSSGHGSGSSVHLDADFIFEETGGQLVIDLENYHFTTGLDGSHRWVIETTDAGFGGKGYVTARPSGANCFGNVTTCGARMDFNVRFGRSGTWDLHFHTRYPSGSDNSHSWALDQIHDEHQEYRREFPLASWTWGSSVSAWPSSPDTRRLDVTDVGIHQFSIFMREDGSSLDRVVMVPQGDPGPTGTAQAEVCEEVCDALDCTVDCASNCLASPGSEEWPECGVGNNLKCCDMPGDPNTHFCAPVAENCDDVDTVLGETWSPPAVGKFRVQNQDRWLVIIGSGYNNRGHFFVGRSIYAVDAFTGEMVGRWDLDDIPAGAVNPSIIDNTVPAGATLVDLDMASDDPGFGYVDRIYIGDLEGRLWKLDTSENAGFDGSTGLINHSDWPHCPLFDAGDHDGDGTRNWAPVITRPAVAVLTPGKPNLYFGTGGDDRAPDSILYRFYSVRDNDPAGSCIGTPLNENDLSLAENEWIVGDGRTNDAATPAAGDLFADTSPSLPDDHEGEDGDRYWSDPIVVSNAFVVFSSLKGKIESINPCENTAGASAVYVYALRRVRTPSAGVVAAGQQLAKVKNLTKIRQSAVVRPVSGASSIDEYIPEGGFNVYGASGGIARSQSVANQKAKSIIAPGTSPSAGPGGEEPDNAQLYIAPGVKSGSTLKVLRWREVPL